MQVRPGLFFLLRRIPVLQRTREVVNTDFISNARVQTISKGVRKQEKSGMYEFPSVFCIRMAVQPGFTWPIMSLTVAKIR